MDSTLLPLLIAASTLSLVAVALLLVLLLRRPEQAYGERVRSEMDRLNEVVRSELQTGRTENLNASRQAREEIAGAVRELSASLQQRLDDLRTALDSRLQQTHDADRAADAQNRAELQNALKIFREALETKFTQLQQENEAKLERIRQTVDEKLHQTLEQRLGESFKLVSERLEQVHAGLGEMKSLAVGVGDLKKILSNVKTRGTWGEVQLGNLLEQTLTPEQFVRNFAPDESSPDRVEFAIKLPGRDDDGLPVWLPLDSKFPNEEYQRLVDAQERGDPVAVEAASLALEQGIRTEARKIAAKYLHPPRTTDFAILFLPTEGLFAEVLRRPGLGESLQREHRVVVSGPTTLTALLTSLQMGFRTLAIERRSGEVWKVLGAVKTEFGKFGETLDKVQKKLTEASNTIEAAQVRSRAVAKKLRPAEELPSVEATQLLGLDNGAEADSTDEPEAPGEET